MQKADLDNYLKAGQIAKELLDYASKNLKVGSNLFEFAEKAEAEIVKKGGKPAFPINLSRNSEAAHYTPAFESSDVVQENDVIKVDVGVSVNGFIADTAKTIDFSDEFGEMIKANEEALERAVSIIKEGTKISSIGETIELTIKSKGFNPVVNLTGHGLAKNDAHTQPTIPNVKTRDEKVISGNMAFAVEPFVTNGKGHVSESARVEIFQVLEVKGVRDNNARKILSYANENYGKLPFAERWIARDLGISEFARRIALRELLQRQCIMSYPVLKEQEGCIVTQAETTLVVFESKVFRLV
ncbi:MAG: type II methionyl aminopeptidase [Candidatus Diapherotrites archaeon]